MPGWPQVAIAAVLLVGTALVSRLMHRDLEKELLWAGVRMTLQLCLLGFFLEWLINHQHPALTIAAAIVLTVNAGLHSTTRVRRRYPGLLLQNVCTTFLAVWPVALMGIWLLRPNDPMDPTVMLPLLGMILGNALNGITLGLDHYTGHMKERHDQILSVIALGATPAEATRTLTRNATRQALTPVLNAMFACGIVSIPGMMTGQMLAGTNALQAAIYQIILMMLVTVSGFAGVLIGLKWCERLHFDARGTPCLK